MKIIKEIKSVDSYINAIDDIQCSSIPLLFRGPSYNQPDLLPSIARPEFINISMTENELLSSMVQYKDHVLTTNKWALLCEAMDEGLPTRLMEWIENPLVALWLACQPQHENIVVYILNPDQSRNVDMEMTPSILNKTAVFRVSDITFKDKDAQRWCTIHPIMKSIENKILPLEEELINSDELIMIDISNSSRVRILDELVDYGFKLNDDTVNLSTLTRFLISNSKFERFIDERQEKIERFNMAMSPSIKKLSQYSKQYHADFDFD